ncbi:uncharacterized protein [Typha angustifolia]|uniref:uncharacterized protein isoform X1 n=1 Tax=Typha angustifolia TaxID=59011 RepID=UPI003C30E689
MMMNRSNECDESSYVPSNSMMSLSGLVEEGDIQRNHLWDWETTTTTTSSSHNPNTTMPLIFPDANFQDCPSPLLPITATNYYPLYSPQLLQQDYPSGPIKNEDLGLNLGRRTYFSAGDAIAIDRLLAKSRVACPMNHHRPPRCQAEGCKADLSGAKHYHRRHKVCEFHSKAAVVFVAAAGGLQQRFCQQCSRFHLLSEFDESKRSCRKRLADHNRRRRKPQSSDNCKEKSKQAPKIYTTKSTTAAATSTASDYQKKTTHLRSLPALCLNASMSSEYQGVPFFFSSSLSSGLLCSSSNEGSMYSTGGGSEHNHNHNNNNSSNLNLLHLEQPVHYTGSYFGILWL